MTDFDEMLDRARRYRPEQIAGDLRALSKDRRFPAVVAWIHNNLEGFAAASCQQSLAGDPGKITHAAGSHHALRVLEGQLRTAVNEPREPVPPADPGS